MRRVPFVFLVPFAAMTVGCTFDNLGETAGSSSGSSGGSPDAERVFAATPGSANPAVLPGIWEAAQSQKEQTLESKSRFEFREKFVVAAARCTMDGAEPVVVGGRAAASIVPGLIEIKEAISATRAVGAGAACGVRAAAGVLPECDPNVPTTQRTTCFDLTGGTLTLYQAGTAVAFVKVAD